MNDQRSDEERLRAAGWEPIAAHPAMETVYALEATTVTARKRAALALLGREEAAEARGREAERADAARFITKEAVSATPRGGVKSLALTTVALQIELGLHVGAYGKDQS